MVRGIAPLYQAAPYPKCKNRYDGFRCNVVVVVVFVDVVVIICSCCYFFSSPESARVVAMVVLYSDTTLLVGFDSMTFVVYLTYFVHSLVNTSSSSSFLLLPLLLCSNLTATNFSSFSRTSPY